MSAAWACDATNANRVRCVDGYVEQVACANGCTPPAAAGDEAVCSCGADTGFSRWNCSATDGNLYACPGGALLEQSCGGRGCDVGPTGVSDTCKPAAGGALQTALAALGPQCGVYSPGTDCGIAVRDLVTGEAASWRGNAFYVSASSAKAIWVAAALYDTSIDAVSPYATPIFANSDNYASGSVIDLLSSPARVNTFMWRDVAVPDSGFCHWNYGKTRDAANCPSTMDGDNFFTASDMVQFLVELWDRSLLGDAKASAELGWMKLSPRSGYGGWIGTQLPAAARPNLHHKAGWLPPSAVPGYSNSNEIGIVEVPGGHAYAVAMLMNGAPTQSAYDAAQLPTLEYASCVVYHAVANDGGGGTCAHP
jgi:beta-lactamase class A